MELLEGQKLNKGKYMVISKIGEGNYGKVYDGENLTIELG